MNVRADVHRALSSVSQFVGRVAYPRAVVVLALFLVAGLLLAYCSGQTEEIAVSKMGTSSMSRDFVSTLEDQGLIDFDAVNDPDSVTELDMLSSLARPYRQTVPKVLQDELMPVSVDDVLVYSEGLTVGFSLQGSSDSVYQRIKAAMEKKGWTTVDSGSKALTTFVKDSGILSWAAVSITEWDTECSVVISAKERDES